MYIFFPVALVFVGMALIVGGSLMLSKVDAKTIATMHFSAGSVLVIGAIIQLTRGAILGDYLMACGFFLFGFTYVIFGAILLFGLDVKLAGWYGIMVAVFAAVFGIAALIAGDGGTAYMWLIWAFLWGWMFVEYVLPVKTPPRLFPIMLVIGGIISAFVPGILVLLDKWAALWS